MAELIVSLGVMLLMFALAGEVFTMTIRSTGEATALTDTTQLLRAFEEALRADLRAVEPGQSLMLIQGNPVNAYWTQEGRDSDGDAGVRDGGPASGYPHVSDPAREDANGNLEKPRADMLMIFTSRRGASFVDPGITGNLHQIVYGHAELGEYVPAASGGGYAFEAGPVAYPVDPVTGYASPDVESPVPAEFWHLARRDLLLLPTPPPPPPPPDATRPRLDPTTARLGDDIVRLGAWDVFESFRYEEFVLMPDTMPPAFMPVVFGVPPVFAGTSTPFARSLLDPSPPAAMAKRLGHYLLPRCASFKVEWSLDPRSPFVDGRLDGVREILWFDPGRFDPSEGSEGPLKSLVAARDAAPTGIPLGQREKLNSLLFDRTPTPPSTPTRPCLAVPGQYSLGQRFGGTALDPNADVWAAPDGRPNLA
ncbi:MAG: hypothetical protein ACE5EX_07395, partial [Phycisphaerae bacterium]